MTRIRLFLFIIAILVPSLAAAQQSMKFEEAAAMLAASCGKDIDDNCRGVNLDATRLRECLGRNQDVVSAKCKADYPQAFGAIQQLPQIRIVQNGDTTLIESLNASINLTVPVWKQKMVLLLGLTRQRQLFWYFVVGFGLVLFLAGAVPMFIYGIL